MSYPTLSSRQNSSSTIVRASALFVLLLSGASLHAQGDMQQRMADLKASMAKNKQALAQYTWKEQVSISVKGQERKVQHYQVKMGPDGKPQKTSLDPAPQAQADSGAPRGRLRQRIVERKKEEYEEYAEQMKSLVQRYIPPDKDDIQEAFSKGNVSFTPGSEQLKITIQNYVKNGDSMVIFFNREKKQISSIKVASYMDDPSDAMNLQVQFSNLADGTSHVSNTMVDGVRKQLTIRMENSDYQKL
jgi:23S rRNA pseudoU1915 N3-methylase RlmH